jgi:hypothetical protein
MISYDTGTKVRVIVANPDGPGTRETTGIVMAGPCMSWEREDRHMVLLTTPRVPNIAIHTNPEIMIVPVQPDGVETGTEVSIKCAQGRWLSGHVVAGPLTERMSISAARGTVRGMSLVLTERGHVQNVSSSRLFPY